MVFDMRIWHTAICQRQSTSLMPAKNRKYRLFLENLKQARLDSGLMQSEAAKLLKRDQTYISKCESGERGVDFIELREFARIYGKAISFFEKGLDD